MSDFFIVCDDGFYFDDGVEFIVLVFDIDFVMLVDYLDQLLIVVDFFVFSDGWGFMLVWFLCEKGFLGCLCVVGSLIVD